MSATKHHLPPISDLLHETPNALFFRVRDEVSSTGWRLLIRGKGKAYVWGRSRMINGWERRRVPKPVQTKKGKNVSA